MSFRQRYVALSVVGVALLLASVNLFPMRDHWNQIPARPPAKARDSAETSHNGFRQTGPFPVVAGNGYEGVIVPVTSPSRFLFEAIVGVEQREHAGPFPELIPWLPEPSHIATTERFLAALFRRASADPSRTIASFLGGNRIPVFKPLKNLERTFRSSKRQYWGFKSAGADRILVGGVPDDPQQSWRFDVEMVIDGGGIGDSPQFPQSSLCQWTAERPGTPIGGSRFRPGAAFVLTF